MVNKIKEDKKLTGVTFVIVRSNGEMLLQLRDEKSRFYSNMWCFPGESGKEGEDAIDMVVRGIQEEYGIKLEKDACEKRQAKLCLSSWLKSNQSKD